jgi:hypothetical protein
MLEASLGPSWVETFAAWADGRVSNGSLRDGWDLARSRSPLSGMALVELREREAGWAYDGMSAPRRRSRASAAARTWWARR